MNQNIFERLHYHSGLVAQGCWDELDDYDREAIQRFGDLVVKECADFLKDTLDEHEAARLLTEHLGVAE